MEADDHSEPVIEQEEREDAALSDSDSGEAIIELDQSQIASPSESEDDENVDSPAEDAPSILEKETKEFFENVSDSEDFSATAAPDSQEKKQLDEENQSGPVDLAGGAVGTDSVEAEGKSEDANNSSEKQSHSNLPSHGESELELVSSSDADAGKSASVQDERHEVSASSSIKVPEDSPEDSQVLSTPQEAATKSEDSVLASEQQQAQVSSATSEHISPTEDSLPVPQEPSESFESLSSGVRTEHVSSGEDVPSSVSAPSEEKLTDIGESADLSLASEGKDDVAATGIVSSASDQAEMGGSLAEPPEGVVESDTSRPVEASSEVSSAGDIPMLAADGAAESDSQDAEILAARQAEVLRIKDQLRELGAESVSDPESGEDMGSDESSPEHVTDYGSPAVVTSSSRHSVGSSFAGRNRRSSLPLSDSGGVDHASRQERASSENGVKPVASSTTEDGSAPHISLSASSYMENISDDENIGDDDDDDDSTGAVVSDTDTKGEGDTRQVEETVSSSTAQPDEDAQKSASGEKTVNGERVRRPIMIASLGNKQQVQTHFNEEQVELDYEDVDGEGDDGVAKEDDDDEREDGEFKSDKDEGELDDDDDCEEGEIKEPGNKKPYVKPLCRFYMRGACTWGLNCRFLHPGVNDKGNYQMIELPGRWNGPPGPMGRPPWGGPEIPEEQFEIPPPPEIPPPESAWERGLRHAKEQMKKASQRKEQESNFEEKRLNLSVDEEREMNKENERRMIVPPKDPYYDQQAFEEDEYYKPPSSINPWQSGRYENFEVRYNRERSFSPYRGKEFYPSPPMERYPPRPYSPPVDKFGRHLREERMEKYRDPRMMGNIRSPSPPPVPQRRPADEWHDPWRRSKSPKPGRRGRSRSRSRRGRRSLSDSSFSSNSRSRSRSSISRSSRSFSRSTFSSRSRSRSPEPAPPGVDRGERMHGSPPGRFMDQPRSAVSVRGRGGYWRNHDQGGQGYYRGDYNRGGFHQRQQHQQQHPPERRFPEGYGYNRNSIRGRPQERKIPPSAMRPKPASASSSGSSRSRSRSRSGSSSSFSRSRSRSGSPRMGRPRPPGALSRSRSISSVSSRTSSSSSSSSGSADSDNLYRDLGSPTRGPHSASPKKKSVKTDKKLPGAAQRVHKPKKPPPPVGLRGEIMAQAQRPGAGDRPPRQHPERIPKRPSASPMAPDDRMARPPRPDRPDRPGRPERPERQDRPESSQERVGRMGPGRPDRPDRPERGDRMEGRPDRGDRAERAERERRMLGRQTGPGEREQSSRPPPPAIQPKAKDPMKLVGLKSNIKLSLINKQPGERSGPPEASPMKRRPSESGDGPPAKRPAVIASPVKTPFEKAAKPTSRAERAKSPTEASRPPRSSAAALPAAAPVAPASIPLPPSPVKAAAKPRAVPAKPSTQAPAKLATAAPPAAEPAKTAAAGAAATPAGAAAAKSKKSMSSRREELLKQLKAVEDAIARKKAKMQ